MGWFQHVSDAVYEAVCAALRLVPEAQESLDRVVPAYVPGITIPQYNSNDNVVFYALSEDQNSSDNYLTIRGESGKLVATKVIPVQLLLSFYGPNADDDSELCWSRLFVDDGYGSPRAILRKNKIVFNYGLGKMPPRPISAPELEGTVWRRRCDLRLSMSYLCDDAIGMNPVEHVPEIGIMVADNTAGKDD